MAGNVKILAREKRRRFIIIDLDYYEICNDLAPALAAHQSEIHGEKVAEAPAGVCRAATAFLHWIEQQTEYIVNGEAFDAEEAWHEVESARGGEDTGRLWRQASYKEITEIGLLGQFGRSTVISAVRYLCDCGLIERRVAERTERKTNEPSHFRLRADRLDLAIRLVRRRELVSAWRFPEPTISQPRPEGENLRPSTEGGLEADPGGPDINPGVPEMDPGGPEPDTGLPEVDPGLSSEDRAPGHRQPAPWPAEDHLGPSPVHLPDSRQTGILSPEDEERAADSTSIYGERNDNSGQKGEQEAPSRQSVDAFADQLCRQLADLFSARTGVATEPDEAWRQSAVRVIGRHSRPESLPSLIEFTQGNSWWSRKIVDMPALEANLAEVAADFHGDSSSAGASTSHDFEQDVI